ncbi:MAG: hypothetical protein NT157_01485 [Candidatus Micrarchaeota archaeon]|nr:hypothetical protein [Candidatus Micrarchaeota archaeon]
MLVSQAFASQPQKITSDYSYAPTYAFFLNPDAQLAFLSKLGMADSQVKYQQIYDSMSDDERKVFSHQLERIKLAESQLEYARMQEIEARAWFFLSPVLLGISTLVASWKAESATVAGLSAMREISLAVDESYSIAWSEVDALEYAGAGYGNYTGPAAGSYNRAQEISLASSVKGGGEASSYAKALLLSRAIASNLTSPEKSTLSGQGGEFVDMISPWLEVAIGDVGLSAVVEDDRKLGILPGEMNRQWQLAPVLHKDVER